MLHLLTVLVVIYFIAKLENPDLVLRSHELPVPGLKSHQAVPVLVRDAEMYDRFKEYTTGRKTSL